MEWALTPRVSRSSFRNPHSSDCRRVEYPWHPLHDQEVIICGSRREANGLVHHCRRISDLVGSACLQIPAWMFDPVQCSVSRLESVPRVSWVSLVQLRQLLVDTIVASPVRGGTDATTPTTIRDSGATVLSKSKCGSPVTQCLKTDLNPCGHALRSFSIPGRVTGARLISTTSVPGPRRWEGYISASAH